MFTNRIVSLRRYAIALLRRSAAAAIVSLFTVTPLLADDSDTITAIIAAEIAATGGDYQQAASYYLQAARALQDEALAVLAFRAATAASQSDLINDAAAVWLAIDNTDSDALLVNMLLLFYKGDDTAAIDYARRFISNAADRHEAFMQLYESVASEQAHERVVQLLSAVLPLMPDTQSYIMTARLAWAWRRDDLADQVLQQAFRRFQADPALHEYYLLHLRARNDDAALVEEAQRWYRLPPTAQPQPDDNRTPPTREILRYYANGLLGIGDIEGALAVLAHLNDATVWPTVADDDAFSYAMLLFEDGRLAEAYDQFATLLNRPTIGLRVPYYLGRIRERQGEAASAMQWYAQVPGSRDQQAADIYIDAQFRIAALQTGHVNPDVASLGWQRIEALLAEYGNATVDIWLRVARLYLQRDDVSSAMTIYDRAATAFASDSQQLRRIDLERVMALWLLGRDTQLEQMLRQLVQRYPDYPYALNALGYFLVEKDRSLKEAARYLHRAYELAPDDVAIIDSLGWLYFKQGDLKAAEPLLRTAYLRSRDPEATAHWALLLAAQDKLDLARQVLADGVRRFPDSDYLRHAHQQLLLLTR